MVNRKRIRMARKQNVRRIVQVTSSAPCKRSPPINPSDLEPQPGYIELNVAERSVSIS